MGARAVISVRDGSGRERRFYQQWASKQFQIQHLAEFIHWADGQAKPLTVATYLDHTTAHPQTLPGEDITEHGWYADPRDTGDLDHRYWLTLSDRDRTFDYLIGDRRRAPHPDEFVIAEDLQHRPDLYAAAARMADQMATAATRYPAGTSGRGATRPPTPEDWRATADTFRRWEQDARTDDQDR